MKRGILRLLLGIAVLFHLAEWRRSKDAAERECEKASAGNRVSNCRPMAARNPGVEQDGREAFRSVQTTPSPSWRSRLRSDWERKTDSWLRDFPGLSALSRSVWLGSTDRLPPPLLRLYQEGGLLHLLALSGGHVISLLLLVNLGMRFLARFASHHASARRLVWGCGAFAVLAGAGGLVLLNPGNESMARSAAMLFAYRLLRYRRLNVSLMQLTSTVVALLLLENPARVASDSFLLSASATWLLSLLLDFAPRCAFVRYLTISTAMPVLMAPVSAFFFAKVALLGAVNGVVVGWIWTLIWIPLGFLAGPLAAVLPSDAASQVLAFCEKVWQAFVVLESSSESAASRGYWSVLRPTWAELLLGESALIWCVVSLMTWRTKIDVNAPMK